MEMIVFIGIPGSGKSTFYKERFYDTHLRINLDMLKTRSREAAFIQTCFKTRQPFVIDNTNVTREQRQKYLQLAKESGFRIVGYYFEISPPDAIRRNEQRSGKKYVPKPAIFSAYNRLEPPNFSEGFDQIFCITPNIEFHFKVQEISPE
jgi:predicted kinase